MERSGSHGRHKLRSSTSGIKQSVSEVNKKKMAENKHSAAAPGVENECVVREQDRLMPIANVIRIMRKVLPTHAKISDDAKETIQECVSEYISFITGEANEHCQKEQRKTITAEDLLWAMSNLGFDNYLEPLTAYLHRYREHEGDRGSSRGEAVGKKKTVEYMAMGVPAAIATTAPPFQMGRSSGYYVPAMGNYVKDGSDAGGSSSAAPANDERNEQKK